MLTTVRQYLTRFVANHRAHGWVAEDPAPAYSTLDQTDGLGVSAPPAEPEPDYRIQGHPFVPLTDQDDFCAVYVEGEGVPCGWAREDHAA